MAAPDNSVPGTLGRNMENIDYVRQMLGELRRVAEHEGCDMLCYLLEMAYIEASEVHTSRCSLSFGEG
ncbi:MAG TPA: hypothetical protein VFJ18_03375 [Pararhizobium sp.]|nr:hypothetical protein [Pararhizobium sp.]